MYRYISMFFSHFIKGNNFRGFLFASLADRVLLNWGYGKTLLQEVYVVPQEKKEMY